MHKVVILGSGKGTNARAIIEIFKSNSKVEVVALVSDRPRRGFLDISYDYRINLEIIKGEELADPKWIAHLKLMYRPDLIVLAGFLKLVPPSFIAAFPNRIINLHPSLLPNYGGKGMYGMRVHQAVIDANEVQSGITIHLVNEHYDEGELIFQATCDVKQDDTPESLSHRIHLLEHKHLPSEIERFLNNSKI
jgi:phosphoribosylglycinamide formyltransferase-1